jgi:phosphoserine phosphatase
VSTGFIATLIASQTLSRGDISACAEALGGALGFAWIDEGRAGDLDLPARPETIPASPVAGVDIVVQPREGRRKRLLVADMDSTMIMVECIDELADYAGVKAEVAAVTERAMRGELDFAAALDARVALLKGLDERTIDACRAERVRLTPGAGTLVRTMRGHGARTLLVSGGFSRFAGPIAEEIGFDAFLANELLIETGQLTGKVARPIVDADGKRRALADAGVPIAATLAVGDGANDIPMLRAAGLGIAFHAKPAVAAAADARIDSNDLTALLYAQGYRQAEWQS